MACEERAAGNGTEKTVPPGVSSGGNRIEINETKALGKGTLNSENLNTNKSQKNSDFGRRFLF